MAELQPLREVFAFSFNDTKSLVHSCLDWKSVSTAKGVSEYQIRRAGNDLVNAADAMVVDWTELIAEYESLTARVAELEAELAALRERAA